MRNLIYIPIVHTEMDLGSLAAQVAQCYRARYGATKWKEHIRSIREMWSGIETRLKALKLNWDRAKLYQDGLPVCGQEARIVRDLARQGSLNHRLVLDLMDRGATLLGTESPELLLREYHLAKQQLGGGGGETNAGALLRERDRFIARRIQETLAEDETGILFMGFAHAVHRHLPDNIQVQFLIHWLPFRDDPGCPLPGGAAQNARAAVE